MIKDQLVTFFERISQFHEITFEVSSDAESYSRDVAELQLLPTTKCRHLVIIFDKLETVRVTPKGDHRESLQGLHRAVLHCGIARTTYRARGTKRNEDAVWTWHLSRLFPLRVPNVEVKYDFMHEGENLVLLPLVQRN